MGFASRYVLWLVSKNSGNYLKRKMHGAHDYRLQVPMTESG